MNKNMLSYAGGIFGAVGGVMAFITRSYIATIKKNVDDYYTKADSEH